MEAILDEPYLGLKNQIKKQHLHQKDIATVLGMDRTTFNLKINRSKGRDFSFSEVRKICSALKIEPSDFYL